MYHMGGLAPVFRTALYGTTLVLQESFDARETAAVLDDHDVTGVSLVPTQLRRLLDANWTPPGALRTVLLGGAPASAELVTDAHERGVPVAPTYGLTETASQVATAAPAAAKGHPDSVGQPLVFAEVLVRNSDGQPVEPGETGELVVDGPTVTPGYLDDSRTAEAFGEHGLHTGDIGYRDADGRLWVLGRADDTILTGGENVHPTDVVAALCEHDAIAEAAVVGLPDEEWGERVAALVVPTDDGLTVADVDGHARETLAPYKRPKTVAVADALPRTASGTVDREAVRERLQE
jgi:O-succinylbenzoic acid--CoA ligase